MNILIYGGGAVGLGLASCLIRKENRVDIIARDNTVSLLHKEGLCRFGVLGEQYVSPSEFNAYSSLNQISPLPIYDYILVCVKSFDSSYVAKDLSSFPALSASKIVLCQNGWGNAEIFANYFEKKNILNACIIIGFRRPQNNQVEITVQAPPMRIGSLFETAVSDIEPLSNEITRGGISCEVSCKFKKYFIGKFLYSCILNPLSAIFSAPYGVLGEYPETRALMKVIAKEVFNVLMAEGYSSSWSCVDDYLETFYKRLLPPTREHESSMLQDLQASKRTEIDSFCGIVVRLGKKHKIDTPYNLMLCKMVKFMGRERGVVHEGK